LFVKDRGETNQAAPVLSEERRVSKVELNDALSNPADMSSHGVVALFGRLVTSSEADLIRCYDSVTGSEGPSLSFSSRDDELAAVTREHHE
jgi:hypothetical protein